MYGHGRNLLLNRARPWNVYVSPAAFTPQEFEAIASYYLENRTELHQALENFRIQPKNTNQAYYFEVTSIQRFIYSEIPTDEIYYQPNRDKHTVDRVTGRRLSVIRSYAYHKSSPGDRESESCREYHRFSKRVYLSGKKTTLKEIHLTEIADSQEETIELLEGMRNKQGKTVKESVGRVN